MNFIQVIATVQAAMAAQYQHKEKDPQMEAMLSKLTDDCIEVEAVEVQEFPPIEALKLTYKEDV